MKMAISVGQKDHVPCPVCGNEDTVQITDVLVAKAFPKVGIKANGIIFATICSACPGVNFSAQDENGKEIPMIFQLNNKR
jgi:hypothetical protein